MPTKIGELTCLRTLSIFVVGPSKGNRLDELQRLNLSGGLEIRHLERVENAIDGKKANLAAKKNLCYLELAWLKRNNASESTAEDVDEKVLDALEPHPNLEKLTIKGFSGRFFPVWMANPSVLENVVVIHIVDCRNCLHLPQLGDLPRLEVLKLENLETVEYIIEDGVQAGNHQVSHVLFPSLQKLLLVSLPNLKGLVKGQASRAAFPSVWQLLIRSCSSFILFPLPSLRVLYAYYCSSSTLASFTKLHSPTTLYLAIDKNLTPSIPIETLENLTKLRTLQIDGAEDELCMPEEGMRALKSLKVLRIRRSETLTCLPQGWLRHLTALEFLHINDWGELVELPEGIRYLQNLIHVELSYLPKMVRLPETLQHVPSLKYLHLLDLNHLDSLPHWLDNYTYLQHLLIDNCPKLASLPDSIGRMANIKRLDIWGCPLLKSRCERENGEDWHKIAHIPQLEIR